jgi:hypothetical protein
MDRRGALCGLGALALAACSRSARRAAPPAGDDWRELAFDAAPGDLGEERALVLSPAGARERPLPVLVALHGRGESGRGLEVGARAWRDDYDLDRLHRRLLSPPLVAEDLERIASAERLALLNASLAAAPYRGLCVACPYTPDLSDRSPAGAAGFARFVVDRLLPRVRREHGASGERTATGIDGVSMGGRLALLVGLAHPEVFGAVGALQPAIRADEAAMFSDLARRALSRAPVVLRLVSSERDPFLPAVRALSDRLRADGVAHALLVVPGPHDYVWNRGPGGAEMLLWHERVQRGLAAP